ncbi:hypothetical protein [Streptomyces sp. NPDC053048]|uniref:hypothetical protein n=1 Tax=Streptomyces sp. NPDC053048 TaxID=3365694 RepID=UPI0037D4B92E
MTGSSPPPGGTHGNGARAPRWVKVSTIAAILLVAAYIVLHLAIGRMVGHAP